MTDINIEQLAQEFKKQVDEVKAIAEDFKGKREHGDKIAEGAKQSADEAITKLNETKAQLDELEQKMARRPNDTPNEVKSLGRQFVESDQFKSLAGAAGQRGKANLEVKATITSLTTDAAGSAGDLVQTTRLPGIIAQPDRKLTIRDLLMQGRMDGNALEYVRETGFTNNAGMVAETTKKPQSDIKFDLVSTTAKVIAHYMKASRQILDDASQLQSYIDGRLRYGLAFKEEQQILNGDGTGQNLLGIIPQATAYVRPTGVTPSSETIIDTLRYAMLQAVLAEYPASGHVLNPIDWASIETLKDSTGQYIIGNPQGAASPTLWRLPVVETQAITAGKFLTGGFSMGAQIFDRWLSRVEVATENEDDFIKNLVTILAEERLALAVYRPEAFIYGDLKPATGP
ncbi:MULTISPECIES: phage major capsid protein [unclassified Acinetobacter]|uniref:phage major capsid protein n=1 Tax=unclassified Acinetobacter TaxID=196816 RepID=UPI0004D3AC86|nr:MULTISPECIES: phage major capsid protein [unclassified Acinetobacter]KEC83291.1 capsid protein [Acinetobacter sp. ETR1]WEE38343.1 phage major capsid protein [Acinetobacter sp. TAC-1]